MGTGQERMPDLRKKVSSPWGRKKKVFRNLVELRIERSERYSWKDQSGQLVQFVT